MSMVQSVLIIDDSPRCAKLLSLAFTACGVSDVQEELHASNAITRIFEIRPDLILLDIKMPEVDGFQVLSAIRARGSVIPVVMCSGSNLQEDVDRAYEMGCNGYVEKPASIEGYRTLAARLIDYWRNCLTPVASLTVQ